MHSVKSFPPIDPVHATSASLFQPIRFSVILNSSPDMLPSTPEVRGRNLDPQTRCLHYHGRTDIIAIKMKCCATYYACKDCHAALADHPLEPWPQSEWHTQAILCGSCRSELTISEYLQCNSRCPQCHSAFNPRCCHHHHFYFALDPQSP